jgi:hypothetical protein
MHRNCPTPAPRGRASPLRRLQREAQQSEFVFLSERGTPFTTAGFAKMITSMLDLLEADLF